MKEGTHRFWDILTKIIGFSITAMVLYSGIDQFNDQQKILSKNELKKYFWTSQNQLYIEICNNAGAMAANVTNPEEFQKKKIEFLTHYYGEIVLVENATVDSCMKSIHSYLNIFDPNDANMVAVFKQRIFELSNACKKTSSTFKPTNL